MSSTGQIWNNKQMITRWMTMKMDKQTEWIMRIWATKKIIGLLVKFFFFFWFCQEKKTFKILDYIQVRRKQNWFMLHNVRIKWTCNFFSFDILLICLFVIFFPQNRITKKDSPIEYLTKRKKKYSMQFKSMELIAIVCQEKRLGSNFFLHFILLSIEIMVIL